MSTPETVVHPAELLQAWIAQGILLPRLQDASAQVNLRAARGIAVAAAGMLEVALVDETHTMVHCVEPHLLSLNYPHLGVDQGESAMVVLHNPHKP